MKLTDALNQIQGPVGFSSLVHGALSGDSQNLERQSPVGATLADAEDKLVAVRKAQSECKSDYAYWGYEGEKSAWEAAVNVLKAAEILGPDNLPDIELKMGGGVVMDECSKLHRWGKEILAYAERKQADKNLSESLST